MRLLAEFPLLIFFGRYYAEEFINQRFSLYMIPFTYIVTPPDS